MLFRGFAGFHGHVTGQRGAANRKNADIKRALTSTRRGSRNELPAMFFRTFAIHNTLAVSSSTLLAAVRVHYRSWLPHWVLVVAFAAAGLLGIGDEVAEWFWVFGLVYFVTFFYAVRPSVSQTLPYWHVIFWVLVFPFLMAVFLFCIKALTVL